MPDLVGVLVEQKADPKPPGHRELLICPYLAVDGLSGYSLGSSIQHVGATLNFRLFSQNPLPAWKQPKLLVSKLFPVELLQAFQPVKRLLQIAAWGQLKSHDKTEQKDFSTYLTLFLFHKKPVGFTLNQFSGIDPPK